MRVDHGRAYIRMPKQLLHTTNVRASFEQMGGERMPERVRCNRLGELCPQRCSSHELLDAVHLQMMPPDLGGLRVLREIGAKERVHNHLQSCQSSHT